MEPTPRRIVLAVIEALWGPDGHAKGSGMAVFCPGQAWIPPRRGCG